MALMDKGRNFVLHRNDSGIPKDREIRIIPNPAGHFDGYPKISVIIPTKDALRNGYFPILLEQLSKQTLQNFETIIIKGDPRQGRAINTGVDIAKGEYVLTLDDDTSLSSEDAFERLLEVMETGETVGMAGGINVIPSDAVAFVRRTMKEIPRRSTPDVDKITDSDLAEHPLLMMRKTLFEKVGGENELIPRGLDPYLREQFRKAGYRIVVVPGVYYSHLPPSSFVKLIKQFYRNGNQAAFCNKLYPQWVIETPDSHVKNFREKRPFLYRAARHFVNMVKKTLKGHLIYVTVSIAYALGFILGYPRHKHKGPV